MLNRYMQCTSTRTYRLGPLRSLPGPVLAAVSYFEARIEGKGGHAAAAPHDAVDPVLATSLKILSLQHLVSREVDPLSSQVLYVTYVRDGNELNVIPPYVEFGGSVRSLTTEGLFELQQRLKEVIEGQAAVHRCKAYVNIDIDGYPVYPATVNDKKLHSHVQSVGKLLLGDENVTIGEKAMAGEDFAFYQQVIPRVMLSIGIRNEETGAVHSPHSPHFFLDEDVLPIGAELFSALAETCINEHQHGELTASGADPVHQDTVNSLNL